MATTLDRILVPAGNLCRTAASALIAGVWRRLSLEEVEARLKAQPVRDQAAIVAGVLAGLLAASLVAAQFGIVGILVFLLAVVLIVN